MVEWSEHVVKKNNLVRTLGQSFYFFPRDTLTWYIHMILLLAIVNGFNFYELFWLKGMAILKVMAEEYTEDDMEQYKKESIKEHENLLCDSMVRYCKGFQPSIENMLEVVSKDSPITIIIDAEHCSNGQEQRIDIECVTKKFHDECEPITMMDVFMHLMKYHKHSKHHRFWEGLKQHRWNKKGTKLIDLPEGEFICCWGS